MIGKIIEFAHDVDINYVIYSSNLIKEFPLLKEILVVHNFMPFDYKDITDNYEYKTLLKKRD